MLEYRAEVNCSKGVYELTMSFKTESMWNMVYFDTLCIMFKYNNGEISREELPDVNWANENLPQVTGWSFKFLHEYPLLFEASTPIEPTDIIPEKYLLFGNSQVEDYYLFQPVELGI